MQDKVLDRETKTASALLSGEQRVALQHAKGKLTARERIDVFLDEGTFEEFDAAVEHRCRDFGMEDYKVPGDGVITGQGTVNGRRVFLFSQDFTVLNGTVSEVNAEKICTVFDRAVRDGAPVVGLHDSGGARIEEGLAALAGYGEILKRNVLASGVVPQISVIMGPCIGVAACSPAITDFNFMVKDSSCLFVTGPEVVKAVTNEIVSQEQLGGAVIHTAKSGIADFAFENDLEALLQLRRFLDFLPANNRAGAPERPCADPIEREEISLETLVPEDPKQTYDMKELILKVVDEGDFFELQSEFAKNIIIGFGRMSGSTVGVVANQPKILAGCLDIDSSRKAARFVRFCDAFSIPIITFVDVPGFLPGVQQEHGGMARQGAKLLFAYGEATVPRLTVVIRRAYGGAYDIMSSKHLRGDVNYAFPSAELALLAPKAAAEILFGNGDQAEIEVRAQEYRQKFASPSAAASRGYIDEVIQPRETRSRLCSALAKLRNKQLENPWRKHNNIPL